jgi:predicted amidohydrolase
MRVAAAQIDVAFGDVEANLEKHLRWIERAQREGCDLLVFPELSLVGYSIGREGYRLALDVEDEKLRRLAGAAGRMGVVFGFVEEHAGAQFFNAAALVRGGEVIFVHRKLNLANYGAMEEAKHFAEGRYVETFPLAEGFVGGILLCSDLWNPALVHLLTLHGATLLLAPTSSSLDLVSGDFTKPSRWDLVLRFYAMLYGLPIVFANRLGREDDFEFWGGSRILGPGGEEVARAEREETLLVAELDYDAVRRARYRLPTVRDSNLELIHREIDRLVHRLGVPELVRTR